MTENTNLNYTLSPDEKSASIVIYLNHGLVIGDAIVKESIRNISTWLRTNAAPETIFLRKAKMIYIAPDAKPKSMTFDELYIATKDVLAYHLLPPAKEPLDYDPDEPNRRMVPITALIGRFRIDANMRISKQVDVKKSLEISREEYKSLYDANIYCPVMPALGIVNVPFVLILQTATIFAV
jgi:hypothetical protein